MLHTAHYSREKDRPQMARILFFLSLSRKIGWNMGVPCAPYKPRRARHALLTTTFFAVFANNALHQSLTLSIDY